MAPLPSFPPLCDNILRTRSAIPDNTAHPLDQTARKRHHILRGPADQAKRVWPLIRIGLEGLTLLRSSQLEGPVLVEQDQKFEEAR
jgi:hypothetical protein